MTKKIILTADDYGACDFINDAIIKAIREKKVNSVAAFVTFPGSKKYIEDLVKLQKSESIKGNKFGIGLHFSVTAGWAVTGKTNTLSYSEGTNGHFRDAYDYPFTYVSKLEMQEELDAQISLLKSWLGGTEIDHVSNHHGVTYIDTEMFEAYAQVLSANKIPMRSALNWSVSGLKYKDFDPLIPSIPLARQGLKLRWLDKVSDALPGKIQQRVQYAQHLNIVSPYCVNDTFYGQPFYDNLDFLITQFGDPGFGSQTNQCIEMMFHLGNYHISPFEHVPSQEIRTDGIDPGYYENRKLELRTLRNFDLNTVLDNLGIRKITYREL